MKKILIIAPSDLPIPAVRGGAVETGIQQIIDMNETVGDVRIHVCSYYDSTAYEQSINYKKTVFSFYKPKRTEKMTLFVRKAINAFFRITKIHVLLDVRPGYTRFICDNVKKYNYDAILIKNAIKTIIPISKVSKASIFLQLHNDFFNYKTPGAISIAKRCTKIIANSIFIKKRIMTIPGIKSDDVLINMNCLGPESFKKVTHSRKTQLYKKYNIDEGSKIILFSGRLVKEKGVDRLIEAVRKLDMNKKWVLLIIGAKWFSSNNKDAFTKNLEQQIAEISDRVKFLGYIPHSDISIYNDIADVVVVPSIWEEPAGRVALEAAAVGTPVIVTDAGGLKEYVNPNTSFVVKRGENFSDDLSKIISEVIFKDNSFNTADSIAFAKRFTSERYYREIMEYMGVL